MCTMRFGICCHTRCGRYHRVLWGADESEIAGYKAEKGTDRWPINWAEDMNVIAVVLQYSVQRLAKVQ